MAPGKRLKVSIFDQKSKGSEDNEQPANDIDLEEVKVTNGSGGGKRVQLPDDEGHDNEQTKKPIRKPTLARKHTLWQLYDDDTSHFSIGRSLRSFKGAEDMPEEEGGEVEKDESEKLGTLLGVYLPSIQNVLGIQMFLRLLWIVGMAGVVESFSMVAVCCLCTFLTSISIAAIATNGVVEGGGPYFMISRSLGPEFGGAIGILYYLANAAAAGMYLAGGVELLLMYMAPNLPQFGDPSEYNESDMFNNFRVYGTLFVLIEFLICLVGIKLIQIVGPLSLACVVLAILSVYAGGIASNPDSSPMVCILGEKLLKPAAYIDVNGTVLCNKNESGLLWTQYCSYHNNTAVVCDPYFMEHDTRYIPGIPGFPSRSLMHNAWSHYMAYGEAAPGIAGDPSKEVVQDIGTSFFVLLAILFPTFTDIICGANLSGDLKDPQNSLAIGIVSAQLSTSFVYLSFVLIYGGCVVGEVLRDKYGRSVDDAMVVAKLAWPHEWVLLVGCFTSTFGAALQCLYSTPNTEFHIITFLEICTLLIGAPKILQAIAKDDVLPFLNIFQRVTKRTREPLLALILTTLITEGVILIGGIDYIAPVCNCFFLMCYGAVNVVCGLQTLLKAPNWRPRFKFYHWSLSLLGALMCLFFMFGSNWYYAILVLVMTGVIYKYIEYKGAKKEWGEGIRGLALSTAQYSLLKAEETSANAKNWRPQLLVFLKMETGEDNTNRKLLLFANQLKAGRGLTMSATMIEGDACSPEQEAKFRTINEQLKGAMKEAKLKGFTEVVLVPNVAENVGAVIQCVGMGSLRPNTIIVGWPNNWKNRLQKRIQKYWSFLDAIHRSATSNMCLLVPKGLFMFPEPGDQLAGTIDVWWISHDGGLLILLPFLLRQHRVWRQCKIRVFTIAQLQDNTIKIKEDLQKWVYQLRIEATVDVVEMTDSDISMSTYERTLNMEERARIASTITAPGPKLIDPITMNQLRKASNAHVHRHRSVSIADPNLLFLSDHGNTSEDVSENEADKSNKKKQKGKKNKKRPTLQVPGEDKDGNVNPAFNEEDEDKLSTDEDLEKKANGEMKSKDSFSSVVSDDEDTKKILKDKTSIASDVWGKLDKNKVRKMHTAVKMNKMIKDKSSGCRLLVLNLPRPPSSRDGLVYYMEYLEALTEGLERVLLVRGSGKEVITIY